MDWRGGEGWNQGCEMFISTEQNGSYVIRENNIKNIVVYVLLSIIGLCAYYFLTKRRELLGQAIRML